MTRWTWRGKKWYLSYDNMIYHIYKDGDIVVETDNIDFVKTYVQENKECSVRDARTGKKVEME